MDLVHKNKFMKPFIRVMIFFLTLLFFVDLNGQSDFFVKQLDTVRLSSRKIDGVCSYQINRPISYQVSFNFSNSIVRDNFDSIVFSLEPHLVKDSLILIKASSAIEWSDKSNRLDITIGELVPISVVKSVLANFLGESIPNFTVNLLMDERSSYGFDTYAHRQMSLSSGSFGARWNHRMIRINNRQDLQKIIELSSNKDLVKYFNENHADPLALKKEEQRLEKFRYWLKKHEGVSNFSLKFQLSMKEIEEYLQNSIVSKTSNVSRRYKRYQVLVRIDSEGRITDVENGLEKFGFNSREIEIVNTALYSLPQFSGKESKGFMYLYLSY